MKQVHLLLEFDATIEEYLIQAWRKYLVLHRLRQVAVIASSSLFFLGLAYGALKIDGWTQGAYRKRLLLGVPAVIIALFLFMVR